jgi:hypothetical protein
MAKGRVRTKPEGQEALDAYGPAIVEACERARALKKALQEKKAAPAQARDKTLEALDRFLNAMKEYEQAVKRRAKAQAVEHARREIEMALSGVAKTARDRRVQLEALEEIEKAVKDLKKRVQDGKDGK